MGLGAWVQQALVRYWLCMSEEQQYGLGLGGAAAWFGFRFGFRIVLLLPVVVLPCRVILHEELAPEF